ncbi:MAG TPA: hypothetical protein PKG95_01705 [Anaerolineaceae bacterium]|nr:hypothetical protein [Anaerolineaceae bacterium]
MAIQVFPVSDATSLRINVSGDLFISGWDQPKVRVVADDDDGMVAQQNQDDLQIIAPDDLVLTVPAAITLLIGHAGGDVELKDLTGSITLSQAGGDVTAQRLNTLSLGNVGGDVELRQINGRLSVGQIGGDMDAVSLQSLTEIQNVGGDVALHLLSAGVNIQAGDDVRISLAQAAGQTLNIHAGGSVRLYLPADAGATFDLTSGDEDICIELGGRDVTVAEGLYHGVVGDGAIHVRVAAGEDILITDRRPNIESYERIFDRWDERWERVMERMNLQERLREEALRRAQEAAERAGRRAEEAARRAEERVQATMRRLEARRGGVPTPPGGAGSRVSRDEKILILQMLQEQKITAEEAERLMQTLENLSE